MLLQLVAPPARKQIRMLAARKSWYSSRRPYVLTTLIPSEHSGRSRKCQIIHAFLSKRWATKRMLFFPWAMKRRYFGSKSGVSCNNLQAGRRAAVMVRFVSQRPSSNGHVVVSSICRRQPLHLCDFGKVRPSWGSTCRSALTIHVGRGEATWALPGAHAPWWKIFFLVAN